MRLFRLFFLTIVVIGFGGFVVWLGVHVARESVATACSCNGQFGVVDASGRCVPSSLF